MRFYTQQHQFSCGIDVHARTMSRCIINWDGESLVHRNMPAGPAPFLQAIMPYREDLVVCVECMVTQYQLADLCAQEGMPFVLGHALQMKAIHGGKAQTEKIDAHKIAVLLRGGMLPQANVYPADRLATRARLRHRMHLMRQRAEVLAHIQNTKSPYNLPAIGEKIASKANRAGGAERLPEPAVPKSIDVALALIGHDDALLRDMALSVLTTATPHEASTLDRRRTVLGSGAILRLVRLSEIHDMQRFPRVRACVSSCRLVKCAKASAGKRYGTSGTKSGHAYLTGAFSEAAVLLLRAPPAGQQYLTRWENKHFKGKALTVLAHKFARAVQDM